MADETLVDVEGALGAEGGRFRVDHRQGGRELCGEVVCRGDARSQFQQAVSGGLLGQDPRIEGGGKASDVRGGTGEAGEAEALDFRDHRTAEGAGSFEDVHHRRKHRAGGTLAGKGERVRAPGLYGWDHIRRAVHKQAAERTAA